MHRIRTIFLGSTGAPWLHTAYFDPAIDSQAAADAEVVDLGAFWGAVDSRMNTGISWSTDPSVAVLTPAGVQTGAWSTTPAAGSGASATELLPPANQALLRLRTNTFSAGREIRGRWYIPGLTEADSTAGLVTAAAALAITTAAGVLIASANSALAVWSRTQSTVTTVQSASVWSQFAVLRSRRD